MKFPADPPVDTANVEDRRGEPPPEDIPSMAAMGRRKLTCGIEGCEQPYLKVGVCSKHYMRFYRHGNYNGIQPEGDALDRLMTRTERQPDGCLLVTSGSIHNGYAVVGEERTMVYGHRLVYERTVGPIPPEHPTIHHTCHNKRCVEVTHLKAVSSREHALEHGRGSGPCRKCQHDDWMIRPSGKRECRECRRRRDARGAA